MIIYRRAMAPKELQVPDITMQFQISDTSPWNIQGSYEVLEDVSEHESQLTIWVLQGSRFKT